MCHWWLFYLTPNICFWNHTHGVNSEAFVIKSSHNISKLLYNHLLWKLPNRMQAPLPNNHQAYTCSCTSFISQSVSLKDLLFISNQPQCQWWLKEWNVHTNFFFSLVTSIFLFWFEILQFISQLCHKGSVGSFFSCGPQLKPQLKTCNYLSKEFVFAVVCIWHAHIVLVMWILR